MVLWKCPILVQTIDELFEFLLLVFSTFHFFRVQRLVHATFLCVFTHIANGQSDAAAAGTLVGDLDHIAIFVFFLILVEL